MKRKHWALVGSSLLLGTLVIWLFPWDHYFWSQCEIDHESRYAECGGLDSEPFPGHIDVNTMLLFEPGVSILVTSCPARKAGDPRAATWLMLGFGVK